MTICPAHIPLSQADLICVLLVVTWQICSLH